MPTPWIVAIGVFMAVLVGFAVGAMFFWVKGEVRNAKEDKARAEKNEQTAVEQANRQATEIEELKKKLAAPPPPPTPPLTPPKDPRIVQAELDIEAANAAIGVATYELAALRAKARVREIEQQKKDLQPPIP